jgi:hypothetical protein
LYALTRAVHGHLPPWVIAAADARSHRLPVEPGSKRIRPAKPR